MILIFGCLLLFGQIQAQVAPANDDSWIINTSKSDEFNSTALNTNLWEALDFSTLGFSWGGAERFKSSYSSVDGNSLELKVDDSHPLPDKFYSGGIRSLNHDYSYGYFEISAKLPGFMNGSTPCGQGFWPCFWTYYTEDEIRPGDIKCRIVHDEIDILEPNGAKYSDGSTNVAGVHDWDGSCDHDKVSGNITYTHSEPLFDDYHKYAAEWLPDRIIFYFDDEPFAYIYDESYIIMNPQYIVIDLQMDMANLPLASTPFPRYMSVDYFRYYELDLNNCNSNLTISSQSQFNSLSEVRKDIFINTAITVSSDKVLRGNSLEINSEFIVPVGVEFSMIQTPCY